MARRRDPFTGDLFEVPQPAEPLPAGMDYRAQMSSLVGRALKAADGDRIEVAARITRLTGVEVSKYMLDAYASEGRETFNLPGWLIAPFETACRTHELTNWLVGLRGGRMLLGREVLNAELGRLEHIRDEAARRARELKKMMGEQE